MNRVQMYCALVGQLSNLRGAPYNLDIPTIELGLDNAEDAVQPAIYVAPMKEKSTNVRGLPNKWTLNVEVYVYVKQPADKNKTGVEVILPLLDAIDTVTSPQVNNRGPGSYANDLGLPNIVVHCAIAGEIEIFGGYLGGQTIARIPFEIVTVG
jgi:hypothetical protein